ncbi:hypothetical protein ACOMHN_066584 [Nucella lapillus]
MSKSRLVSRGQVLCTRVPVSDFDLGTHPRAGSTRDARGVGAGSRVRRLAMVWRVPDELPFIVLKDPSEKIEDRSFRVRKQKLLDALLYLKSHNEDYRHIVISRENADLYPEDDIIQSLPQLDPQEMKIPDEELQLTRIQLESKPLLSTFPVASCL